MGPDLPRRLRRRWAKYNEEYIQIAGSKLSGDDKDYSFASISATQAKKRNMRRTQSTTELTKTQLAVLKRHSDSRDYEMTVRRTSEGLRTRETKRRWSIAAAKAVLKKKGTFASLADLSVANAKAQKEREDDLKQKSSEEKALEEKASTTQMLEILEKGNIGELVDQDLDEFNRCKTYDERKGMINTLLNLGKARQQ